MIKAEILADSINDFGDRITTMQVTFPRFILAEFNTHRMFSRNSASSRAIPFKKMVESVQDNPFIPIAWQKDHKGMQGTEYQQDAKHLIEYRAAWLRDSDDAVREATLLNNSPHSVTKQLCNRLLEPFMWHTCIVTSTEWENFFDLRCPQYAIEELIDGDKRLFKSKKGLLKELDYDPIFPSTDLDWLKINKGQAEIHMMATAEAMWDALQESEPIRLKAGEWHVPFRDKINYSELTDTLHEIQTVVFPNVTPYVIKVATSMCARVSYTTIGEEKEINYKRLMEIHDRMAIQKPFHASPFEHIAQAMSKTDLDQFLKIEDGVVEEGWCRNFKGWKQYRFIVESGKTV